MGVPEQSDYMCETRKILKTLSDSHPALVEIFNEEFKEMFDILYSCWEDSMGDDL